MNLHAMLARRADEGRPLRIGLIGAGKFGSMYLSQVRRTPGMHLVAVADLSPQRAREAMIRVGWEAARLSADGFGRALRDGSTFVFDDPMALVAADEVEIVIDATGDPAAGIAHALACCRQGKHIVMVNVEADALAGPLLAQRAREAGVVYSLAYGDQPALICEMVTGRAPRLRGVGAGKGTSTSRFPRVHARHGVGALRYRQAMSGRGMNAQSSSRSSTVQAAIEMARWRMPRACGAGSGLSSPCASTISRSDVPRADAARSCSRPGRGRSSLERDGRPVFLDLRWAVGELRRRLATGGVLSRVGIVTGPQRQRQLDVQALSMIGSKLGISVGRRAARELPARRAVASRRRRHGTERAEGGRAPRWRRRYTCTEAMPRPSRGVRRAAAGLAAAWRCAAVAAGEALLGTTCASMRVRAVRCGGDGAALGLAGGVSHSGARGTSAAGDPSQSAQVAASYDASRSWK